MLSFLAAVVPQVTAQERSTQSPEVQSFFLNPDLKGAGQNSVNLYSGDVNLPINLLTVTGRGGLSANVSAFYNSNIQNQRDIWALEAPTSILGLGWSMDYDKIVVDHKNTGTIHDDDFYLVSGGSSNELIMTSSSGGVRTFETKNYQFWKITYTKNSTTEEWEIVKEDGTKFVYGGSFQTTNGLKSSTGNVIQWGVKWGNWIGSSMRTSGQSQHAIAWNLSKVENTWGDAISYEYLAIEEEVGRFGEPDAVEPKTHTKASYLKKIKTPEGKEVEFFYGDKHPDEYIDPHQELTDPYEIYLDFNGPTALEEGENGVWNSVVGNTSGTVSYNWEYQYQGDQTWYNGGTGSTLSTSFMPFDDSYTINLKLTVTDSQNSKSITKFVRIFPSGNINNPQPACSNGCSTIPDISSAPLTSTTHYEPDAYQEKFESKFLNRIQVTNETGRVLYFIDFGYGSYGSPGDPEFKRLLTSITHEYPNGEALPDLKFSYYSSNDTHPAGLKKVTYPTGAEVSYTYSEKTINKSDREKLISAPSGGYDNPRVFIASDYVVVTWKQEDDADPDPDDDIYLQVYTWEGEWVKFDYGVIENTGDIINISSTGTYDVQNFEIFLEKDFFLFVSDFYEIESATSVIFGSVYRRRAISFMNDKTKKGNWDATILTGRSPFNFEPAGFVYGSISSKADVALGKNYIAISNLSSSDLYTYKWDGKDWIDNYETHSYYGGNNGFLGGSANYFVMNELSSSNDKNYIFYIDELGRWGSTNSTAGSMSSSISGFGYYDKNYISTGNSLFSLSLNGENNHIMKLSESYAISQSLDLGVELERDPVFISSDETVLFAQSATNISRAYRFNGNSWVQAPTSFFSDGSYTMSVGLDLVVKRLLPRTGENGSFIKFNPNSNSWSSNTLIDDNVSYVSGEYLYTDVAGNLFIFGKKPYFTQPNGISSSLGSLYQASGRAIEYNSIRTGFNFVAYNTLLCNGSGGSCNGQSLSDKKARAFIVKNGAVETNSIDLGSYSVYDAGSQQSTLVGASIVVGYDASLGSMENSSQLKLFKFNDSKFTGDIKDYPVTKVEINNGFKTSANEFEYVTSTATVDASGYVAQYNEVKSYMGLKSQNEGYTVSYFFNGLSNTDLPGTTDDYPVNSSFTNADNYLNQVKGLSYRTEARNSNDEVISETENYWEVTEVPILRVSDSGQIDLAYYVRQRKTENTTDGFFTYSETEYNSENGLPIKTLSVNYDIDGTNEYTISSEVTYAYEKYSSLESLNIISQPTEQREYVQRTGSTKLLTSKSVSTWKDWGSGKWAPHASYVWKGTGSSTFSNASNWGTITSPDTPSDWIKFSEITQIDNYGNPTETLGADGIYTTSVLGFDGTRTIANFNNAQKSEVRADGFDEEGNPGNSSLNWNNFSGGTWNNEDGVLKVSKSGSTEGYLQTQNGIDHSSSIIEFDVRFTGGGNTDWLGFQFRTTSYGCFWSDCGTWLKIQKNGAISLNRVTSMNLSSGNISGSMKTWRHVRLVSIPDGTIKVYVDGVLITELLSNHEVTEQYFGFIIHNASAEIDNFRIYPNDATATSVGYDPDYLYPILKSDVNGYLTRTVRDKNHQVMEILDADDFVISTGTSVLSRQKSGGNFVISSPNATYSSSYPSHNAVRNSGGEYGETIMPIPWQGASSDAAQRSDTSDAYSGYTSLVFSPNYSTDEMFQFIGDPEFLWQGKKYYLSFRAKINWAPSAPTLTISLQKEDGSGNTLSVKTTNSFALNTTNWYFFEAEISTGGGEYFTWNNEDYASKIVITANIQGVDYIIDDLYLGEVIHGNESRPGYSVTFSDASGNPVQSQSWNGANYSVSHTEYDDLGRQWKNWWPYEYNTGGKYDSGFSSRSPNYSETEYYSDPLSRVKSEKPVGSVAQTINYSYGNEIYNGVRFAKTTVTDLGGTASKSFSDYSGNNVLTISAVGTSEEITSGSIYDPYTKTSEYRPPNYFAPPSPSIATDWVSTAENDFLGSTISGTSPDGGTSEMKYDELGRLRFSQSEQQKAQEKVSFTSYDTFGRPLISGEGQDNFGGLNPDVSSSLETDQNNYISVTSYDDKPSSGTFPWSLFSSQTGNISPENTDNAVVAEAYKTNGKSVAWLDLDETTVSGDGGVVSSPGNIIAGTNYSVSTNATLKMESASKIILEPGFTASQGASFNAYIAEGLGAGVNNNDQDWQAKYYSYDFEGKLIKKWILTQDKPELRTEIAYTYNDAGQVLRQHTKVGTSQHLYHFYSYDALGRLIKVYISTTSTRPSTPLVTYTYDSQGRMEQRNIDGVDLADVSYNFDSSGRLNEIIAGYYDFYEELIYNTDGTISEMIMNTYDGNQPTSSSYLYSYDNLNRLTLGDFDGNASNNNESVNYDKHGNIQTLSRHHFSTQLDNLTYNYQTGTNKLTSVTDAIATTPESWDAEDATYQYDLDGSMIASTKSGGGAFDHISYGTSKLPVTISVDDDTELIYRYNSEGWRTHAKVVDKSTGNVIHEEFYIMDGATTLGVADANGNIKYWNLFGQDLFGRMELSPQVKKKYYVKDHLGSTRQVIDDSDTMVETYDYYPFGAVLRSNLSNGETKETFTGKELDEESGLHYFGARYYDAALGRWSVMDPAGQYATPYGYNGGNPVMYIDPNGEFAFIPIAIGIMVGASLGSMRAGMNGENPYEGMIKGAIVGGVSGALGQIGGGSLIADMAWAASEGVVTNGVSNAMNRDQFFENAGRAGIASAGTSFLFNLPEAIQNTRDGFGFNTDIGSFQKAAKEAVSNGVVDPSKAQRALDFWVDRFGGPKLSYIPTKNSSGGLNASNVNPRTGDVSISGVNFIQGPKHVTRTIVHESAHYYKSIVWTSGPGSSTNGFRIEGAGEIGNPHGTIGYYDAIKEAGRYNIGYHAVAKGSGNGFTSPLVPVAWKSFGWKKWLYQVPVRF
ncbi:MAG: RHS repeat-associated core domain-containing protein [Balneola sp.]